MGKKKVPAVEGMFTMDAANPTLIGGKSRSSGSYYFPKDLAGNDQEAASNESREEVFLSREGKVWSYTSADYPPALPYIITEEPFKPFVIAAVELEKEGMVICGQMMPGIQISDMEVGMNVQVALDVLYEDGEYQYMVWKWEPVRKGHG
ncbi:MAG: benzoylsuccinyl-CoA thiolase [Acidimicrobiaceae bacterium]|nr:benzoylsuccinyl-CoA thiolase [Acidimicrobiaceae bacterium]